MENTNLFTLKVTANNPKMAEKILKAVVKNYPSVAEFVIGSSQLTLMDEAGFRLHLPIHLVIDMRYRSAF